MCNDSTRKPIRRKEAAGNPRELAPRRPVVRRTGQPGRCRNRSPWWSVAAAEPANFVDHGGRAAALRNRWHRRKLRRRNCPACLALGMGPVFGRVANAGSPPRTDRCLALSTGSAAARSGAVPQFWLVGTGQGRSKCLQPESLHRSLGPQCQFFAGLGRKRPMAEHGTS
jgi:hypothetical protein